MSGMRRVQISVSNHEGYVDALAAAGVLTDIAMITGHDSTSDLLIERVSGEYLLAFTMSVEGSMVAHVHDVLTILTAYVPREKILMLQYERPLEDVFVEPPERPTAYMTD